MELNDLENLNKQFRIARIVKLLETNNDKDHHFYYLVYLHLINKEHTKFKRIRFVIDFDAFDIMEYFDKDCYSQSDINYYKNEIASSIVYNYLQDDIFNKYQDLVKYAQQTIDDYNKIARYY